MGRIEEFVEGKEWTQYVESLQYYFAANEIEDATKKRAIFLTVIGPTALLHSLVAPEKPGDKSYDELKAAMELQHSPTPAVIVQGYEVNTRF